MRIVSHALVLGLTLAACAPGPSPEGPKPLRIGAILMQQDQFFQLNELGMRDAAKKLGVDLLVQNAAGALDKEVTIVDTFLTQKVDAILVSPLSTKASAPALEKAHQRGTKIVTYNNALEASFPACNVTSDQVALGATSAGAARAYIEQKLGGKARVALIGFASQLPEQGGARMKGFQDEITKLPGVEIVAEQDAWTAPQAATTVQEILTKNPDVIWSANEGGTVGAVTAVMSAGKAGKVAVFGTDVSVQLLDFLLADDGILQAVTAQKPYEMGETAVEAAVKVLRGEPVEREIVLPGELFGRDTPDDLRAFRSRLTEVAGQK